ncbi:Uncharacterised protein [Yersinia enterocolitica]|nr:Uncharacterised protein [Yersinia enterocolitica]
MCPWQREQADRKDAVIIVPDGSSRAIRIPWGFEPRRPGADALLFCLSSPLQIEASGYVSSMD